MLFRMGFRINSSAIFVLEARIYTNYDMGSKILCLAFPDNFLRSKDVWQLEGIESSNDTAVRYMSVVSFLPKTCLQEKG